MSSEAVRPSTLDGIKRLAKQLKNERSIQHARALDEASRLGGFESFRHASNQLTSGNRPKRAHPKSCVFISIYWKNRDTNSDGRETLVCWLSEPWSDLVAPSQFEHHRALRLLRAEGPDHLALSRSVSSQSSARRRACAVVRTLEFMDATKLSPSKGYSRAVPNGRWENAIPGCDHYSTWYDRKTRRYLFVDEPYEMAADSKAAARTAWAQLHGWVIAKPEWAGMYNPDGGSRLFLVSDTQKGIPLEPIIAALNKLPPPIVEDAWSGESAPFLPLFVSPGAIAKMKEVKRLADAPRKKSGQRNTVGYVQTFVGPQRRPKGRMPIEAHAEVGRLLKSVLKDTYQRKGVYNKINAIRSELDEWTQREYSHAELPSDQFFALYYREEGGNYSRNLSDDVRANHIASLNQAKTLLNTHYPDSPPLRSLQKKLDAAIGSLQNWKI